MISLDKLAYTSAIRMVHPNEKLFFSLSFLILTIYCNHIAISFFVFLLMSYACIIKSKLPAKSYVKLLALPFVFTIFGVLGVLFAQWKGSLGQEDYFGALALLLKAFASTSCLYFLILTTPMTDFFYSLKVLKCPKLILELMLLIYRYIFVLLDFANTVYISQDSRLGYASYRSSFSSLGKLISSLFLASYQKSMECFHAMESRNYDGEIQLLSLAYQKNKMNYCKVVFVVVFLLGLYVYRGRISWNIF